MLYFKISNLISCCIDDYFLFISSPDSEATNSEIRLTVLNRCGSTWPISWKRRPVQSGECNSAIFSELSFFDLQCDLSTRLYRVLLFFTDLPPPPRKVRVIYHQHLTRHHPWTYHSQGNFFSYWSVILLHINTSVKA